MSCAIHELTEEIAHFCSERDWDAFHTNKDLAAAIAIEAAELQDLFLWNRTASLDEVKEELADVLIYSLRMAERNGLDVAEIIHDKMAANAVKYPVSQCKGSATKYSKLNKEGVVNGN